MNQLSDDELVKIRKLIIADERATWPWLLVRRWSAWIVASITAVWAIIQVGQQILKAKLGQ